MTSWQFPEKLQHSKLITTRFVLNHSAGLSSEFGPGFLKNDTLLSVVDVLSGKSKKRRSLRIVHRPGEGHIYSNLGFGLLQLLIEDISGKSFKEYMNENVFKKLGMTKSNFEDPLLLDNTYGLATPYDYRLSPLDQERFVIVAAAGLNSNLQDLKLLLKEETKNHELVSKSVYDEMHYVEAESNYGLGHMIYRHENEVAFIGHTGLGTGWNSCLQFIPDSGQGIVVLTNGDNGYYIHSTLTCNWYYSRTGKGI